MLAAPFSFRKRSILQPANIGVTHTVSTVRSGHHMNTLRSTARAATARARPAQRAHWCEHSGCIGSTLAADAAVLCAVWWCPYSGPFSAVVGNARAHDMPYGVCVHEPYIVVVGCVWARWLRACVTSSDGRMSVLVILTHFCRFRMPCRTCGTNETAQNALELSPLRGDAWNADNFTMVGHCRRADLN